jgi:hypothetical protein
VRVLLGATVLFALLAVAFGVQQRADAGVALKVTVNSLANDDPFDPNDGDCEGLPNDNVIGGDCTLAEAIVAANNGEADVINFHPPVFPKANPGVIIIDSDIVGNNGCLPTLTRDNVTIDSEDTGVILDGDGSLTSDSPEECDGAIHVAPPGPGFDFTLLGGKNFTLRQFDADGIRIDGDFNCAAAGGGCSLGRVKIDGTVIEQLDDTDGIAIFNTRRVGEITINNNNIDTNYPALGTGGDDGIDIFIDAVFNPDGYFFASDMVIDITNNTIFTRNDEAVEIDILGDLGNPDSGATAKITTRINNNPVLIADREDGDDGVDFVYEGCIFKSAINVEVDGNGQVNGGDGDGVDVDIFGDDCFEFDVSGGGSVAGGPGSEGSDRASVDVSVSGNGEIRVLGDDDEQGVDVEVFLCCASSSHVNVINIDNNGDIVGDEDGVEVFTDICCGDNNTSRVSVSGNGRITGRDDDGVDIEQFVGNTGAGFDSDDDSDGNLAEVKVNDNDRITGVDDDGIYIDNEAGAICGGCTGSADDNEATVEINGNRRIDGADDGMEVYSLAFSDDGEADDNKANITVQDNEQVDGGGFDGAYLEADAGSFGAGQEGDDNETTILVQGNERFVGNDGDGIETFSFAGGDTKGSERNTTNVSIIENGDIEGEGGGDDGLLITSEVCCSSRKSNVNNILIDENSKIIGHDDDGISINNLCCKVVTNVVTITNNGVITGGAEAGIDYDADPDELALEVNQDGFFNTVNVLTISGNRIENSGEDGIEICCGAFESDENDVKSVISENVITGNRDHGIEVDSSFGLNIGPANEIFLNGNNPRLDAGIEIDNSANVAEEFCAGGCILVPANHNRITQNMIYDNVGLGIDLASDHDLDGGGPEEVAPNGGADGNSEEDHGVGCTPKAQPISPNDCLPAPIFKTLAKTAGETTVTGRSCSLCTVELFIADETPADQGDDPLVQFGEGAAFLIDGEADADGNFSIVLPCAMDLAGGTIITATATDKVKNTSEFAENISLPSGTNDCTLTPTSTPTPTFTPVPTNTPTNTPVPPSPTPIIIVATPTPGPAKACGDVNDDGEVNAIDAQLILQFKAALLDELENPESADVNNSGDITSVDAALILQLEAGFIGPEDLNCP